MQGQGSTARRDELLRYQTEAQQHWQSEKLFEVDAPAEGKLLSLKPDQRCMSDIHCMMHGITMMMMMMMVMTMMMLCVTKMHCMNAWC